MIARLLGLCILDKESKCVILKLESWTVVILPKIITQKIINNSLTLITVYTNLIKQKYELFKFECF